MWRAAAWALVVAVSPALAGDPGELFPSTDYNNTVHNPVKDPGKARPRQEPKKPPATVASTRPASAPSTAAASTKPAAEPVAASAPAERENAGTRIWGPYRLTAMNKFLSPAEQTTYDEEFAETVKKALSMTAADRKIAMDTLTEAVAERKDNVKRFVLLNVVGLCVRNNAPLEERSTRAMLVLPLLTEETLEVMQSKADCLTILANSSPEMASDKLWGMLAESQAVLAKLQVQTGFPAQAVETFIKARTAYYRVRDKGQVKSEVVVECATWVDYAMALTRELPGYRKVLAETPTDADASTKMAMAHLVLYADLEGARSYGVNASETLKALAAALDAAMFPRMSAAPAMVVGDSVKIAEKLLAVAAEATPQLEKHTLSKLVVDRLDRLKADYPDAVAKERAFNTVHNDATRLMKESAFKPVTVRRP